MGPNRDEGLPLDRSGSIGDLISYPGRIFAAIDASSSAAFSSIMEYNLAGWHGLYHSPSADQNIFDMQLQIIPDVIDRLWFIQGQDIVWIPLPGRTLRENTDVSVTFAHEGVVESGWISANMREMQKFYKSLRLLVEDAVAGAQEVEADYRTDDSSTWVALPGTFDAFRKEIDFTTTTPPNITARRLRYRLRLQTDDNTKTPKVKAAIVEAVVRVPVKYSYTMSFRAADNNEDIDGLIDSYTEVETLMSQLDSWANSATVLTMRTVFSPFDNKEVLLDPTSLRPTSVEPSDQVEEHVGQLTVIEI
jgi:hypothetical protein